MCFASQRNVLNCSRWSLTRLGRYCPLFNSSTWQHRPCAHRPWLLLRPCSDRAAFVCFSGHQKKSPGDTVWVSVPGKNVLSVVLMRWLCQVTMAILLGQLLSVPAGCPVLCSPWAGSILTRLVLQRQPAGRGGLEGSLAEKAINRLLLNEDFFLEVFK